MYISSHDQRVHARSQMRAKLASSCVVHVSRHPDAPTKVQQGVAKRRGCVLGIDCIIEDAHCNLRDIAKATCVSFVQTSYITRETLFFGDVATARSSRERASACCSRAPPPVLAELTSLASLRCCVDSSLRA